MGITGIVTYSSVALPEIIQTLLLELTKCDIETQYSTITILFVVTLLGCFGLIFF